MKGMTGEAAIPFGFCHRHTVTSEMRCKRERA